LREKNWADEERIQNSRMLFSSPYNEPKGGEGSKHKGAQFLLLSHVSERADEQEVKIRFHRKKDKQDIKTV